MPIKILSKQLAVFSKDKSGWDAAFQFLSITGVELNLVRKLDIKIRREITYTSNSVREKPEGLLDISNDTTVSKSDTEITIKVTTA